MGEWVIAWDLETVPDLSCVARVNRLEEADEDGCRAALGEKFPKQIFHKIACIGALVAERREAGWEVRSLGAPHAGERTEAALIQAFVDRIADLRPQLVSFNGASFDLPVLRYRAMINRVSAPGLECRNYFHRYSEHHLDLCDALAGYSSQGKLSLDALCCAFSFPGKPDGMDGSKVAEYVAAGRIGDVASYCEADVIATYRVWLRYQLFCGRLDTDAYDTSETNLLEFIQDRGKPHLAYMLKSGPARNFFASREQQDLSAIGSLVP